MISKTSGFRGTLFSDTSMYHILCHICASTHYPAIDESRGDPVTPCEADQQDHQPFGGQGMPHHLLYGGRFFPDVPPGFFREKEGETPRDGCFYAKKNEAV